ncbi:T9SS type A sorting domain-containing protein [candidate division KSB1 bacterium]|nr:T9SS type A sorting domain-containing protein [candidate division KSB1 bacterium]
MKHTKLKDIFLIVFILIISPILLSRDVKNQKFTDPIDQTDVLMPDKIVSYPSQRDSNVSLIGRLATGPCNTVKAVGSMVYFGNGSYLEAFDFSKQPKLKAVNRVMLPALINDLFIQNDLIFVADAEAGVRVIEMSSMEEIGFYDTNGWTYDVFVQGDYAYVADGGQGLSVLDVRKPNAPVEIAVVNTDGWSYGVTVRDNLIYLADGKAGVRILNIDNPSQPSEIGFFNPGGDVKSVLLDGNYAYITDRTAGVWVLDVTQPDKPVQLAFYDTNGLCYGIEKVDEYLFVADGYDGLLILDVLDPAKPMKITSFNTEGYAKNVAIAGNFAFVADWGAGLRLINIQNFAKLHETGVHETGSQMMSLVKDENYLYIADRDIGLKILTVEVPENPKVLGMLATNSYVKGLAKWGNYVYLANYTDGLKIIDVSDPAMPREVGALDTDGNANRVAVSGDYAYIADGQMGLQIINVADPQKPYLVGHFDSNGWSYGVVVSGNYAYLADGGAGLCILDVSNPAQPVLKATFDTGGHPNSVMVRGNYAYITDCEAGVQIIDVADPANPKRIGKYDTPGCCNEIAVYKNYAYVADGLAGVLLLDISRLADPIKIGYYDTGDCAFSVCVDEKYAYIADMEDGLYILENDIPSTPIVIEAEHMDGRIPWLGSPCEDGWRLTHENHPIHADVPITNDAYCFFTVIAKAEIAGGATPWLKVEFGDIYKGACEVTSTEWQEFYFSAFVPAGTHRLSLVFLNDFWNKVTDRNLLLDKVIIMFRESSEMETAYTFEAEKMRFQYNRNYFEDSSVVLSRPYCYVGQYMFFEQDELRIEIAAKGDSVAGGWPEMELRLDNQIVQTYLVNDTNWVNYQFVLKDYESGKHELKIHYKNSSWAYLRNLYIDKVTAYTKYGLLKMDFEEVSNEDISLPSDFQLAQNYPNPFNPETSIHYQLPEAANVRISIFNMLGQEVQRLVESNQPAGYYEIKWNGLDNMGQQVVSGVYLYRIEANDFCMNRKMLLVR